MKDWDKKVAKADMKQSKETGSQPKGKIIPADLNLDDEEVAESDPEEDIGPEGRSSHKREQPSNRAKPHIHIKQGQVQNKPADRV